MQRKINRDKIATIITATYQKLVADNKQASNIVMYFADTLDLFPIFSVTLSSVFLSLSNYLDK